MNDPGVEPDVIHLSAARQTFELPFDISLSALDQQSLRVQPPEHVVGRKRRDKLLRLRLVEPHRLRVIAVDDADDPPVFLVAQIALVRGSFTPFEAVRRGIVLNDEVVPVEHPDVAVGADFRGNGGGPFVVAGE